MKGVGKIKKIIKWGIIGFVGLIILSIVFGSFGGNNKSSNTERVSNTENTTDNSAAQNENENENENSEALTISNTTVNDKGYGLMEVIGEVTNNDTKERTATLKATFYDADGKILGTAIGAVNSIASGQTKTFNLLSTDKISNYAEYKVEVDTMF